MERSWRDSLREVYPASDRVWFGSFAHRDRPQAWRPNPQSPVGGAVRDHLKPDADRLLGMQHALLVKSFLIGSDDRLDIGRNAGGIGYQ